MLHAGIAAARADGLVERVVADRAEQFAIAGPETRDGGIVECEFDHRFQRQPVAFAGRALGRRIEIADLLDLVAEQVETYRFLEARREQIDDTAADGIFAGLTHRLGFVVAVLREEELHDRDIDAIPHRHREGGIAHHVLRRHALRSGVHGRDDQARLFRRRQQLGEGGDTLPDNLGIRRDAVVRQTIPGRERHDLKCRIVKCDQVGKPRHAPVIGCEMEHVAFLAGDQLDQQARVVPLRRTGQGQLAAGREVERGKGECVGIGPCGRSGLTDFRQRAHDTAGSWKLRSNRVTRLSCSGGSAVRPVIQS